MNVAKGLSRSRYHASKKTMGPSQFQLMQADPQALDRLDIRFRWGHYGIQVLRCHLATLSAGHVIQAHKHRDYEFHFIPSGTGSVILEDGSYPVHAGMFYLTGPQVIHQQEADVNEQLDELCLHIDIVKLAEQAAGTEHEVQWGESWEVGEADECIRQLDTMLAHPTVDQYDAMSWFLTAYRAWHDRELGAFSTIRQALIQIMLRAARAHHVTQINTALPSRDMNAYRYGLATQYIRDNYAHPLTLEEVAEELHICGRQLQRILDEQAQETFSGYLERYRLTQVCMALTHADQTIEQLAVQHGFSSGSYLHYVFKKRMGITPLQYREQQRIHKFNDSSNVATKATPTV
ncbi:AraC family transcriptional regulator [Dictyobacter alpinus]|uniref:AraC family transcriptional regulator n=1 Tax=Dictyobacter alpinus TaxID=2014873 RepID=A0A402B4G8_9CHLR|nr:AraC family transcriptional regulator [Dictyobacter alpinus]GCE26255.1 AraC family transcriptional regulator [Dictyobacter alpinus]